MRKIVAEDFPVGIAFGPHDGGAYLAETDAVSPACAFQSESLQFPVFPFFSDDKCRTVKMGR